MAPTVIASGARAGDTEHASAPSLPAATTYVKPDATERWIAASIAAEGPPEMLMELAYRLATEDSPLIEKIRSEVIVAIMPVADHDGRDRSIDWYYSQGMIKEKLDAASLVDKRFAIFAPAVASK